MRLRARLALPLSLAAVSVGATRVAHAQAEGTAGDVQATYATPTSPPPRSTSAVRRDLDSETQLRLGGAYDLLPALTAAGTYNAGVVTLAGAEGFWVHHWFTAGFQFAIAPLILAPGGPTAGPPPLPSPTDTRTTALFEAGLYATLHLGRPLRTPIDPTITVGVNAAASGGPGAPDLGVVFVGVPVRATLSIPIAHRIFLGPYLEFEPYFPVGCGNTPCHLPALANLGGGIALTFTAPSVPPPPPPRPPPAAPALPGDPQPSH